MQGDNHMEGSQVLDCSEDTTVPKSAFGFLGAATSVGPQHVNPGSPTTAHPLPGCWVPLLLGRAA